MGEPKTAVYWWSVSIDQQRKKYNSARRTITRNNRRGEIRIDELEKISRHYTEAKKELKKIIKAAKKRKMEENPRIKNVDKPLQSLRTVLYNHRKEKGNNEKSLLDGRATTILEGQRRECSSLQ